MDIETVTPDVAIPTPSNPLVRKALIIGGATVGLILAGGLAYLKNRAPDDDMDEADDENDDSDD